MRTLVLLLLTGCATRLVPIDFNNPPPADWPKLQERIIYVQPDQLSAGCGPRPAGAMGCSVVNFERKTCEIYLASTDPALLEHERWHCRGYPHVRSPNRYAEAWERWKATRR